jgi:glycine/D-amino acid oxidase-like deaminating enzyme
MHSGVTLAPGVAVLVANEVLDGSEAPLLAPFRPDRFTC